jgi:predicted MFS family arabinose efflux permease
LAPQLVLAGIATSIAVTFNMLLPVVPVLLERRGPHGAAGAATAALFMGAVAGELLTPWLMSRWSASRLLIAGQLMTAVPSLVYVLPQPDASLMLVATAARGLGMGVAIVVAVALVADLTPPDRRGRAIGYFGLALSAPGIVLPSVAVSLLEASRVDVDALVAFIVGVGGALLALMLPRTTAPAKQVSSNLLHAFRRPGLLLLFFGFVMVSSSFGAVITFAPVALPAAGAGSAAAFLFVAGSARAATRWLAGVLGDRRPGRLVLAGGIGLTLAGLVALGLRSNPAVVLFAGLAFGGGYGAVQTAAYLAMTARGTADHRNTISALWNSGIDLGASLGGTLLGLTAARFGYGAAIWVIPVVVLLALPILLAPARSAPVDGRAESSESMVETAGAIGP